MDNNPERRMSESSDEEDIYVLALEPPDEPDDTYFDALQYQNGERHEQKEHKTESKSALERENGKQKAQTDTVLETNLDTLQQQHTRQQQGLPENKPKKPQKPLRTDDVYITFHALIPCDVDFNPETDRVFLNMWDETLSTDIIMQFEMKCVGYRKEAKNAAEVIFTAVLTRKGQYSLRNLSYRYYIERHGIDPNTNLPRESMWELVYTHQNNYNRTLSCCAFKNMQGVMYHQYDGFIYQPQEKGGFFQTVTGIFQPNKKAEDAKIVTRTFSRDIVKTLLGDVPNSETINGAIDMTYFLKHCVEKTYKMNTSTLIGKAIWEVYTQVLKSLLGVYDDLMIQRKIAVCILLLNLRNGMQCQNDDVANELMCKSFLLKPDPEKRTTAEFEYLQNYLTSEDRENIKSKLIDLAIDVSKCYAKGKNAIWMYLFPIIHFLEGACKPYEEMSLSVDHRATEPKWWGISSGMKTATENFKRVGVSWNISLRHIIVELNYMFEVDFYLPRAILACLRLDELKDALDCHLLPPEICCASVVYFISTRYHEYEKKLIEKCTETLFRQVRATSIERLSKQRVLIGINLSSDLLNESLHLRKSNAVMNSVDILLSFVAWCDILETDTSKQAELLNQRNLSLQNVCKKVLDWINTYEYTKTRPVKETLEIWDRLLSPRGIQSTHHINEWKSEMKKQLSEKIKGGLSTYHRNQYERQLLEAYCAGIDTYSPELQDLLSSFILMVLSNPEQIEQTKTYKKLWKTMSRKFVEEWNKKVDTEKSLNAQTLFSWTALPNIMKVLNQRCNPEELGEICFGYITCVKSLVKSLGKNLFVGNISPRELKLLQTHRDNFLLFWQIFQSDENHVKYALNYRIEELNRFYIKKATLETLRLFCGNIDGVEIETRDIEDMISRNVEESSLSELVLVSDITNETKEFSGDIQLNIKDLSKNVSQMISQLELLKDSGCFRTQWKKVSEELPRNKTLSLDDLCEKVYQTSLERLHNIAEQITSGAITYKDMEELLGKRCGNNYEAMMFELKAVCADVKTDVLHQRLDELKQCRQIEIVIKVASALLKVKNAYGLNGNFGVAESLTTYDVENLSLVTDKDEIMTASLAFNTFTMGNVSCLEAFANSEALVTWLRKVITGGMKELKVFVDLGMTSAGDDQEKISRVQSLHAAVNGFSALIFELRPDFGWQDIIQSSQQVWEELANTPKLADKLEYACRQLHWFEEIKRAHGAVEVTAFMQANIINECGLYKIGTHVWEVKKEQQSVVSMAELTDINQVLKMTVVLNESKDGPKEYTYNRLQDLQSRLMLVAGEADGSNNSVERFNMVLDGVVRLCNIYMKLVKSGCMLFRDFDVELYCDTNAERPVVAILEFESEASNLKCRKTENEQLEDVIHKIATSLENCYTKWLEHVDQHRQKFLELNHFTADQLVILQRELAKLIEGKEPSEYVYPMLNNIKENCKPDDVKEALTTASNEIETDARGSIEQTEKVAEKKKGKEKSKEEEFVEDLINLGQEKLVPFALKKFPNLDLDEAMWWCENNANNIDELEATQYMDDDGQEKDQTEGAADIESVENLISKTLDSKSQFDRCENMLEKFEEIWKRFLESIEHNIKNFLSLKHLGILLHHLSKKDERSINRNLPKGYSETSPNLIVCENELIWNQTLSLYLTDQFQPLPQKDEVLTCSERTTFEQVDIFLRRAFFNSNGKIHTVINADRMDFSICEGVEQRMIEYQRAKPGNYRLVFICGSNSENRSVIVSSLDRFRRTVYIMSEEELCICLADRLRIFNQDTDTCINAASVDFQRSTVRVVLSNRSGCGKTLYKIRRDEDLRALTQSSHSLSVSLPLHERKVDIDYVTANLLCYTDEPTSSHPRIFHIDITNEVQSGIDYLLFNLLILGELVDKSGHVWRKMQPDLYLIETMESSDRETHKDIGILKLLPYVKCRSPQECMDIYSGETPSDFRESDQLFDSKLFQTEIYQTPYTCLRSIDKGHIGAISEKNCIETMLRHCGVSNPTWSEIYHFVKFLNTQLQDFEKTDFVSKDSEEDLPGFPMFVRRFLIQMSRDFSSRSLYISEESHETIRDSEQEEDLHAYEIKRTWERSPHPYLFFNADRHTFTFLGFYINDFGDLVDLQNDTVLQRYIMNRTLLRALLQNGVPIKEDFDSLQRNEKIARLCRVMGVTECDEKVYDKTYELTTDNCKKMMAIYMRFRCGIPVIVMGETGCGKTRLVQFLCELMVPRDEKTHQPLTTNMIIMKVHGGVTNEDIILKVLKAEQIATENCKKYDKSMFTVLFFDEANTTESIGLIKEIICDNTMEGKPLDICKNLKFVAACNPYRKHPEEVIQKLEKAGLGYHIKAVKTKDRFGRLPMRRLVYRVQPLPQSLIPFVWDFGQLSSSVEDLYIRHMVRRYMANEGSSMDITLLPNDEQLLEVISSILTQSQEYMRNLKDECSFVSLRDVDRVLQVMCWFYSKSQDRRTLFLLADEKLKERNLQQTLTDETRSLILALSVCYHASLSNKDNYWNRISQFFRQPCELEGGYRQILEEINRIQEVFLDSVNLEDHSTIARNQALKENVFLMVICIELRIPLFLVGKPGSSKSLAKVIVTDAMQGRAAKKELFKELKQVQMVSFQCSPLSSPEGIISTFHQCASFQQNYRDNLDTFVSAVVLDEIGLAEDSERMPLKTLHPLLEDGCSGDESPEDYKKVAFIGISNWSLDPAKMNRGIFVQRQVPDSMELENTACGICASTPEVSHMLIQPLSSAYLKVFNRASDEIREFFGLRDFYSLMKMIKQLMERSKGARIPTYRKLRFAVRRNFSGLDNVDTFKIFLGEMKNFNENEERLPGDPDDSFGGLMKSWVNNEYSDSRHLLLLTENYSALSIFQQAFLTKTSRRPIIIFGSSFRRDQEYTQICRNINKIKLCMETGKLVILVNSDNLYESLYDALNQYYIYFGGERYVDLGLGSHRVKCPVHPEFKLIVVAEKQTVYEKFPIPLINRLEKHCLTSATLLNKHQNWLARVLREWVEDVTKQSLSLREKATEFDAAKVFIGYHHDACSTIALEKWTDDKSFENVDDSEEALNEAKDILLWCATPDALLRLTDDREEIQDIYWNKQAHESLKDYLSFRFKKNSERKIYAQVTTHSTLLTVAYRQTLWEATGISPNRILLLEALPSFDTEQQFISKIKAHIQKSKEEPVLLVIQCETGDRYSNLIACAKYAILDECTKLISKSSVSIVFIVQLTPMENKHFHNIQCGEWHSAHIDNLYATTIEMPSIHDLQRDRMSVLIAKSIEVIGQTSLEQSVDSEEQINKRNGIDLRKLIDRSLQRAVSLVRDQDEHKHRSTRRITLIMSILHEKDKKDCDGFVKGISILVKCIMADRENELLTSNPGMWLEKEASSVMAIEQFGTLRRACLQAFDTRMSPILGGIFAALDTNHNLNILEYASTTWQRNLWINLLNTREINQDSFEKVNTERGLQFEVRGTGFGDTMFQCKMPFSWILHSIFEGVLKKHSYLFRENNDQEHDFAEFLRGTEVANALDDVPKTEFYDVLESYIYDFVWTVYPEEKDRKLVWISIKDLTLNRISENEHAALTSALMDVHIVYQESAQGLKYFRDISNVWQDCTDRVISYQKDAETTGNNLAFIGLSILLDHLSPVDKDKQEECFKTESGRKKWLGQIHRFRQVVNQTLVFCQETMSTPEEIAKERSKWNRIVVMQLFLENLCSEGEDTFSISLFPMLWTMLGQRAVNMKSMESLQQIETFLNRCCTKAKSIIERDSKKCAKCGVILTLKRLRLPCEHELCEKCEAALTVDGLSEYKCDKCRQTPEDSSKTERNALDRLSEYRQRCNLVLMDIISQLCFAENSAPKQEVIEWLMSYTVKSEDKEDQFRKNETTRGLKDTGVLSNKVFKAFVFKHLVRTDEAAFRKQLEMLFKQQEHNKLDDVIMSLIFCIEDNVLEISNLRKERSTDVIRRCLQYAQHTMDKEKSIVDQIYCSAQARVALSLSGSYINMLLYDTDTMESSAINDAKNALQIVESFCQARPLLWKFLLRSLTQEFGTDTLLSVCRSTDPSISWIKMDEQVANSIDFYTSCGVEYSQMSNGVIMLMIQNENSNVVQQIQTGENKQYLAVMLELVVHRKIELQNNLKGTVTNSQEAEKIEQVISAFDGKFKTASLLALDSGYLQSLHLNVETENYTDREVNIKCMLFHWLSIIRHIQGSCCLLLKPLIKLALKPGSLKKTYLPCMPQDELADIRQQLLKEAERSYVGQQTRYYQCKNGHSYEIGQCGRPYVKAKCICGADIGGQSHKLDETNTLDDGSDRSQTGHCLGDPNERAPGSIPERSLTATQCAMMKCLLHLTMYLGCGSSSEDLCALIEPRIEIDQVYKFLWDHIELDLKDIQACLSLSVDEVFLFVHSFLDTVSGSGIDNDSSEHDDDSDSNESLHDDDIRVEESNSDQSETEEMPETEDTTVRHGDYRYDTNEFDIPRRYEHVDLFGDDSTDEEEIGLMPEFHVHNTEDDQISPEETEVQMNGKVWKTKRGRSIWEEEFNEKYLNTLLEERTKILEAAKSHLQRSSGTGILALLTEEETNDGATEQEGNLSLENNPKIWIYRKPASIEHLQQALRKYTEEDDSKRGDFIVLRMFLEQLNELQAVRFVPSIIQLHKALLKRYSKKIYQSQASKITLRQLKEDEVAGKNTTFLVEELIEAWDMTRNALKNHELRTERGRSALPLEFTNMRITDDTKLTFLLPTMEGNGICMFALLEFLIRRHNEVIETYMSSLSGDEQQTCTVVLPKDLTSAHMISFHPQTDLLPIILANCSINSKHTVDDQYNFEAIEKRIVDRFLSTKSRVIVEQTLQIDLMVYRSDLTDVSELDLLCRKIPQDRLSSSVKSTICDQMQDIPGIRQVLSDLDIVINFLNITGGNPDDSLQEYMFGRLKLGKTELKAKIQQICQLKHVKYLWMTLSYHKSYIMAWQRKHVEMIFENVGSEYQEVPADEIVICYQTFAEALSKERLADFLEELFEFITLELTKKENKDAEDYFDKSQYRLKDCLNAFAETTEIDLHVDDIPDDILSSHSLHIWIAAARFFAIRFDKLETEL